VVLLLVFGGWWIVEREQQQVEPRAERTSQEAKAWEEAESINTVAAYERYHSQAFATVSHKKVAANRIRTLKARIVNTYEITDPTGRVMHVDGETPPSPMQSKAIFDRYDAEKRVKELRVARIAEDKRAKDKAEEAEKVRVARIAADKRAKEKAAETEKVRVARVAANKRAEENGRRLAKEKAERVRRGRQRLDKLGVTSKPNFASCVSGNCQDGYGIRTYKDGHYEGNFNYFIKSGQGTFYWVHGDSYEGNWKDGTQSGQGTYYYASSGDRYEGSWRYNERGSPSCQNCSTQGTYYYADGSQEKQTWRDGRQVR